MDRVINAYLQGKYKKGARRLLALPLEPETPRLRARLRRWVFHRDAGLRHSSIRILGQLEDVLSMALFVLRLTRYRVDCAEIGIFVQAFRAFGPASIVVLSDLMRTGDTVDRNVGIAMLGHLGGDALPILLEALPEDPPRIGQALAGNKDPRVVSALACCLENSPDLLVARALVECSSPACAVAVPEVARALRKVEDGEIRDALLNALGKMRDPSVVPVLRLHLRRHEAIRSLGLIPGREALNALLRALTKDLAIDTLDEALCSILTHPEARPAERRRAARLALSRLDLWGARIPLAGLAECRPELERAARSRDPRRRLALARALPRSAAACHYHYAITYGDRRVRRQAALWGHHLSLEDVWTLAVDPNHGVRKALAQGITPRSHFEVLRHLARDRHSLVRARVAESLKRGGPACVPILARLAQDRSRVVRGVALGFLRQVLDIMAPDAG